MGIENDIVNFDSVYIVTIVDFSTGTFTSTLVRNGGSHVINKHVYPKLMTGEWYFTTVLGPGDVEIQLLN